MAHRKNPRWADNEDRCYGWGDYQSWIVVPREPSNEEEERLTFSPRENDPEEGDKPYAQESRKEELKWGRGEVTGRGYWGGFAYSAGCSTYQLGTSASGAGRKEKAGAPVLEGKIKKTEPWKRKKGQKSETTPLAEKPKWNNRSPHEGGEEYGQKTTTLPIAHGQFTKSPREGGAILTLHEGTNPLGYFTQFNRNR